MVRAIWSLLFEKEKKILGDTAVVNHIKLRKITK